MRGATDPRAPRSETIQTFVCRSQPDDNLLSRVHGSAGARGRGGGLVSGRAPSYVVHQRESDAFHACASIAGPEEKGE